MTGVATLVGTSVGAPFALLRVPIPAAPEPPGVMATVGVSRVQTRPARRRRVRDLLDALGP